MVISSKIRIVSYYYLNNPIRKRIYNVIADFEPVLFLAHPREELVLNVLSSLLTELFLDSSILGRTFAYRWDSAKRKKVFFPKSGLYIFDLTSSNAALPIAAFSTY